MADDFATPSDIADLWRPLTEQESAVAQARIIIAAALIRQRFRTIDQRIAAGDLSPLVVRGVVADMVKRVLQAPDGGWRSRSETVGPFTESITYADEQNRLGLYLTDVEASLLAPAASTAPARSIRMRVGP